MVFLILNSKNFVKLMHKQFSSKCVGFTEKLIQLFDQYLCQINAKDKFSKNTLVSRNFYLVTGWY